MHSSIAGDPLTTAAVVTAWAALGIGFMTSLGHCIGMCGPLIGAFSLAQGKQDKRVANLLSALLVYHLGRLNSYAVIGLIFALLSAAAQTVAPPSLIRAWAFLISGSLMILLGMGLAGWLPTTRAMESSRLGQFVAERFVALAGTGSMAGRYLLGVLNGFLPCGPVYAMAMAALPAPSPLHGAGLMVMFGAGTIPVLVAIGLGAGRLAPALQRRFNLVAALLVMIVGLEFLFRAGKLFGWIAQIKWGFVPIW